MAIHRISKLSPNNLEKRGTLGIKKPGWLVFNVRGLNHIFGYSGFLLLLICHNSHTHIFLVKKIHKKLGMHEPDIVFLFRLGVRLVTRGKGWSTLPSIRVRGWAERQRMTQKKVSAAWVVAVGWMLLIQSPQRMFLTIKIVRLCQTNIIPFPDICGF